MNFTDFAKLHDVVIDRLNDGDRIHRCGTVEHPRSKNGAYFFDGRRGFVQNWETGQGVQWWNDPAAQPWTDAEKAAWGARRREEERERMAKHREASRRAQKLLEACESKPHGYLCLKGFPDTPALVTEADAMAVPMRDVQTNELLGVQLIRFVEGKWEKKMLPGMRAKGAVLRLGPPRATESALVEGFATGLSAEAAAKKLCIRAAIYVTFSAGNLEHVANLIQGKRYVLADNDTSGTGQRCADATGLPWVMSDVPGNDFNDDHQQFGVMHVARKLMAARSASAGGRAA